MKTVFDDKTRQELVNRVKTLDQNSTSQWGKMNIYQMLKHCTLWEEWVQGKNPCTYKQAFIGFLFGKFALRRVLKDEKPLDRNVPTSNKRANRRHQCPERKVDYLANGIRKF